MHDKFATFLKKKTITDKKLSPLKSSSIGLPKDLDKNINVGPTILKES